MDLEVEKYIEIVPKEGALTKELMDNYERYFYDVNENGDFYDFETQEEKHMANIAQLITNGEDDFIEGYGYLKDILESWKVTEGSIREI